MTRVTRTRQKNLFLSQRKKPHKDQRTGRKKHTKEKNSLESTIKLAEEFFLLSQRKTPDKD
jgi:hypothetical protein